MPPRKPGNPRKNKTVGTEKPAVRTRHKHPDENKKSTQEQDLETSSYPENAYERIEAADKELRPGGDKKDGEG